MDSTICTLWLGLCCPFSALLEELWNDGGLLICVSRVCTNGILVIARGEREVLRGVGGKIRDRVGNGISAPEGDYKTLGMRRV